MNLEFDRYFSAYCREYDRAYQLLANTSEGWAKLLDPTVLPDPARLAEHVIEGRLPSGSIEQLALKHFDALVKCYAHAFEHNLSRVDYFIPKYRKYVSPNGDFSTKVSRTPLLKGVLTSVDEIRLSYNQTIEGSRNSESDWRKWEQLFPILDTKVHELRKHANELQRSLFESRVQAQRAWTFKRGIWYGAAAGVIFSSLWDVLVTAFIALFD